MLLQSVIFPPPDDGLPLELFFRSANGDVFLGDGGALVFRSGSVVRFDTYFGAFFASKWLRCTVLSGLALRLRFTGRFSVRLLALRCSDGKAEVSPLLSAELSSPAEPDEQVLDFGALRGDCAYAFELTALSDGASVLRADYVCDDDDKAADVTIAADICTFRREEYLLRTLSELRSCILENRGSLLYGHLSIFVADNGGTLDCEALSGGGIRVFPNRNTGGAGGFTRGILEILDNSGNSSGSGVTHILLMDDDAIIKPFVLERTYAFLRLLRPEHRDLTVAGALLCEHSPWLQYEAGAQIKDDRITVLGHGLDMRLLDNVLADSARSELIDYSGWWFSCIPVSQIRRVGLPMPFFLHRDDIEYGLRLGGRFITVPGICVWHEMFEKKLSGVSEYYDMRNLLIVNAIHGCGTSRHYRRLLRRWFWRNLISHRYKYIDMNLAGVHDALRGVDWLLAQDCEELHRTVASMNYKLTGVGSLPAADSLFDIPQLLGSQREERFGGDCRGPQRSRLRAALTLLLGGGVWLPKKPLPVLAMQPTPPERFFRTGTVIHCDADGRGFEVTRDRGEIRRCMSEYHRICLLLDSRYDEAAAQYRARRVELCSAEAWRKTLGLESND